MDQICIKKGSYEPLMQRLLAILGAGKHNDGTGWLLHKRKDGGAQWIYRYILHRPRREMGLGVLRDVS
ncbi:hypothetical protein MCY_00057 [Bartonella rattimassiliensis 15908]|uniref:Integrase DNA-binding domain-containing protein n=1 Tax=Bartonella rattimassiliensis 15908 TaxID=1094556 RepID=J0QXF6_9HYPH|nr:hypothetical protein MCY_00057 [Bartonella rattimassiliensis 15908]